MRTPNLDNTTCSNIVYTLWLYTGSSSVRNFPADYVLLDSTTGASGKLFAKALATDNKFAVNFEKPLVNNDAGTYYLKAKMEVNNQGTGALTNTLLYDIEFTINPDCSTETLTPLASISDIVYTFKQPEQTTVLPQSTASYAGCPVEYSLLVLKAGAW